MIVAQFFVACLVALACGSLVTRQDASPPSLQERWYNCRANWCVVGSVRLETMLMFSSATMLSVCLLYQVCISHCHIPALSNAYAAFCTEPAFTWYYKNCLQCSGPDNFNAWQYYSEMHHLDSAGASCGLSTTPLSGKQPDVPGVGNPSSTTSAGVVPSISSSAFTLTARAQSSVAVQVSNSTAPASGATGEASVSSAASSVAVQTTTVASMHSPGSVHPSSSPTQTHSHAVSTKASGSSTAVSSCRAPHDHCLILTQSASSVATANPAGSLHLEGAAGVLGAIFIGALFGM
jgi:hypothetical protein